MNTKALSIPSLRPKTRATAEAWGEKGHSYKPLPIRFRRDGFDYRQIAREGDAAMIFARADFVNVFIPSRPARLFVVEINYR